MINSVKTKILGIAIFPLVIALGFMFNLVFDKYRLAEEVGLQEQLNEYVISTGSLLHEIQKERGASGVFLGSNGDRFQSELSTLRSATDGQLAKYKKLLAGFDAANYGRELSGLISNASGKLASIKQLRGQVSAQSLLPSESLTSYTAINAGLLNALVAAVNFGTNAEVSKYRTAYLNYIQGKERAGVERAVLAGTFGRDRFEVGAYSQFTSLVTEQETYFNVFKTLASPEQLAEYDNFLTDSAVVETQRLRDIALTKGVVTSKASLMADLNLHFGYGGAIHLFKNYVLRKQENYVARFDAKRDQILQVLDQLLTTKALSPEERSQVATIRTIINQYSDAIQVAQQMFSEGYVTAEIDSSIKISDKPAIDAISALIKSSVPGNFGVDPGNWFKTITAKINLMKKMEDQVANDLVVLSEGLHSGANNTLITLLLLAAVVSGLVIVAVLYVANGISLPLKSAVSFAEDISNGKLTGRVDCNSKDEIGTLSAALNHMAVNLKEMVQDVESTTQQLTQAAGEMSQISGQTSSGVLQQQSELQQVSTAMTEMSQTVIQVSDNAESAKKATQEANSEACSGRQIVDATTTSIKALASEIDRASIVIKRLESETASIGTVLDVIGGVAEQTNLLALNAAIEAARAGEQGRGFAVVADEVRSLASRTQEATLEIQKMIENLQRGANEAVNAMELGSGKAEQSVEQAGKACDSLESIAQAFTTVAEMNELIASSTEQQSEVAQEINKNIVSINNVASDTASGASQTESASGELSRLAGNLQQMLAKFSV